MASTPQRRSTDAGYGGTQPWPDARLTPVDKVRLAMAAYSRAKVHEDVARRESDMARRELDAVIRSLVEAATGGHQ